MRCTQVRLLCRSQAQEPTYGGLHSFVWGLAVLVFFGVWFRVDKGSIARQCRVRTAMIALRSRPIQKTDMHAYLHMHSRVQESHGSHILAGLLCAAEEAS